MQVPSEAIDANIQDSSDQTSISRLNISYQNINNRNPFQFDHSKNEENIDTIIPDRDLYFHDRNKEDNNTIKEKSGRKYNFDILRRKLKILVINKAFKFIQSKIKNNGDKLKKIEANVKREKKIDEERIFMNKTLGEIFSNKVSDRFSTIQNKVDYNKKKIDKLRNSNNELKNIFDITFIQCLNHFIGKESIELLNGMTTFEKIAFNDEILKTNLWYVCSNYEKLIMTSRPRNSKPKKNKI
jgi:hypothetical protein